jgi:bis(5'-nucleosyl)-tetraphosphatase (symmetrical)
LQLFCADRSDSDSRTPERRPLVTEKPGLERRNRDEIKRTHAAPVTAPHVTLEGAVVKSKIMIIGDVHGCVHELQKLLEKCDADNDTTVILVGDLVNKGPYSAEVIALVRKIGAYCVRGNHDEAALAEFYKNGKNSSKYDFLRKLSRYQEYVLKRSFLLLNLCRCLSEDIAFLEQLPYTISLPEHNCIIVHAGLIPGVSLPDQTSTVTTRMRNIITTKDHLGEKKLEGAEHGKAGSAWAKVWKGPQHVYFGHDAKRGLQEEPFATGLDTGCCYGLYLCCTMKFL